MATQRRTKPVMERQPPQNERWGPEIFLHLEFRVSWSKKQPAKNHQVTYRSRGARERAPAFPRQVPAPNTNYLAAIHNFDQRQSRVREWRENCANSHPNRHHQMQEYYCQGVQQPSHFQIPVIQEPEPERLTRADAQPSYERGRSAPPPLGENPWDVNVSQDQARASAAMAQTRPFGEREEIRRKPLPAPPSEFRLGDGGQPWSTWSLPVGYDPDMYPKDDEDEKDKPARSEPTGRNSTTYATNPTIVSVFSPEPSVPAAVPRTRDLETGRARELGALSAAMMTVDNGFESQWWYQGNRETVATTDEPRTPQEDPMQRWSTGPMIETPILQSPERLPAGIVSPMTDAALSPAPPPAYLQRTLSTRSEELWFRERGSTLQ